MHGVESTTTTVAFELAALEGTRHPGAVFEQTRGWARSVGLVSDRPTYVVTNFAREWGMDYGFHSGPRGLLESLASIRAQPEHDAGRYLLIGTDAIDPQEVSAHGWAFLRLEEAAEAAGWELGTPLGTDDARGEYEGWP